MPDLRHSGFAPGSFRSSARLAAGGDFLHALGVAVGVKPDDSHEVALFVVITLLAAGFAIAVGHVASQRAVWVVELNGAVQFVVLVIHDAFDAAVRVERAAFAFLFAVVVVGDSLGGAVGVAADHKVVKFSGGVGAV